MTAIMVVAATHFHHDVILQVVRLSSGGHDLVDLDPLLTQVLERVLHLSNDDPKPTYGAKNTHQRGGAQCMKRCSGKKG